MKGSVRRERSFDTAESETLGMWRNSMGENREALQTPTIEWQGVGRPHSTNEAGEQSRRGWVGSGVRRGKEDDQGERTTSALAPDPEPGMRVTGVCGAYDKLREGISGCGLRHPVSQRAAGRP
jgi:hypothetical protein